MFFVFSFYSLPDLLSLFYFFRYLVYFLSSFQRFHLSLFSLSSLNSPHCAVLPVSVDAPHTTRSCGIKIRAGTQLRGASIASY